MSVQAYGRGERFSPESSPRNGDIIPTENTENTKKIVKYITQTKVKKHRRGKGKENNNSFSILLVNLRGYRSKEYSLKKAVRKTKPSMILMNETQLRGSMKVSMEPAYITWSKNRISQTGGGVATSVARAFMCNSGGASEGVAGDEYLITRIASFKPELNVVNCYGEQRKTTKTEVEEKWNRLRTELENIRARNEFCCFGGDLNKLVGNDELGVPDNHSEITLGGKLLRELLASGNWVLVNGTGKEVVSGGPFTRIDPATGKASCLNLFIVSKELKPYIRKLEIDNERKLGIARAQKNKKKGRYKLVFPDHFPLILTLENLPLEKEEKQEKIVRWNLTKEGGWDKYRKECEEVKEKLERAVEDKNISIEAAKKKFDQIHNRVKYKAFGKVTLGQKKKEKNYKEIECFDKEEREEIKAKKQYEEQVVRAEKEMKEIDKIVNGKVGKVWEIKKENNGRKEGCYGSNTSS